jgi:hypothetical protein
LRERRGESVAMVGYRVYAEITVAPGVDYKTSLTINADDKISYRELLEIARESFKSLSIGVWRYGPAEYVSSPEIYQTVEGGFPEPSVDLT